MLSQNKPKLLPNSHPGVYICIVHPTYSKILTSCIDHKEDSIKCKCVSLGVTEHTKKCHGQFNGIHPKIITVISNMYKTKVGEVLDINRLKTLNETDGMLKLPNRDNDHYFITKNWKLLFHKIGNFFFSFAFLIYMYNILFISGESNDIDPTFLLLSHLLTWIVEQIWLNHSSLHFLDLPE